MVYATNWFSKTNKVQEGAISVDVASDTVGVDLVDSVLDVISTPIYYYQSIPVLINGSVLTKYKQFIRSEVINNAQVLDACVALVDNCAWTWGGNSNGELGNNSTTDRSSPVSVVGNKKFTQVVSKNRFYEGTVTPELDLKAGLDYDGYAFTWGINSNGELGNNTTNNASSPVSVVGGRQFVTISCGEVTMSALDMSGFAWTWGSNANAELGDNTTTNRSSPTSVVGGLNFVAIKNNLAIDTSNNVWSWGFNEYGQLGNGTTVNKSSPVAMVGICGTGGVVTSIAKGTSFAAMLTDRGQCYTVGNNLYGQLGDNTAGASAHKSSPVSVYGNKKFVQVVAGSMHILALDNEGTIWSWGYNSFGQLGDGTTAIRSTPVSVNTKNKFVMIQASGQNSIAIDLDGYLWSWGRARYGALGNNSTTDSSTPVSVKGGYKGRYRKIY